MYLQLTRFLLPLVLAMIAPELGRQVLNGGMARMPQAIETLASYGLAWGLVMFMVSTLAQTKQLGLVLVDSEASLRMVRRCILVFGAILAGALIVLALTPVGIWVIEDLHAVKPPVSVLVREALFWLIPIPILDGLLRFSSGLLIRIRRTEVVSYATLTGIGASILAVFGFLPFEFVQEKPILLPLIVTYAGVLSELSILLLGYRRYRWQLLDEVRKAPVVRRDPLTVAYVLRFFWPLALVMAVQGGSRPLVNLFVSRGPDGTEALAVLTIVYTLAHIPYGWVNEIRNLPAAFQNRAGSLTYIRRFAAGCGLVSFGTMALLFWTPVRVFLLETLIGVKPGLAALCTIPLILFTFFPLTVMIRAYLHGIGLLEHRTRALAPSGPSRILAIVVMLFILPAEVHGATRGVAALLSGFVLEATVVWWALRRRKE